MHHLANDLTGVTFGLLTVIRQAPGRYHRYVLWECRCECGGARSFGSGRLLAGNARHCGCQSEVRRARVTSPTYQIWRGMWKRCTSEKSHRRYAGRGIRVCARWRSFGNFLADMGPRPTPLHSIDRKDNDGHYEPSNCRWATQSQQLRNTSRSRSLTFNGETLPLLEWCDRTGITEKALRHRIERGWTVERALTQPQHIR